MLPLVLMLLGFAAGEIVALQVPGLEWSADANRLQWTLDTGRLHCELDGERLYWKTTEQEE